MWRERSHLDDDPLMLALKIVMDARYNTRHYINEFIQNNVDDIDVGMRELENILRDSASSRRITYREINPSLSLHDIYTAQENLNENDRITFTRFRVSSHSLAVEIGRWNRRGRGRLPLEERLCECGYIQTEVHVVEHCTLTEHLRNIHNFSRIHELFSDKFSHASTCKIIKQILDIYS